MFDLIVSVTHVGRHGFRPKWFSYERKAKLLGLWVSLLWIFVNVYSLFLLWMIVRKTDARTGRMVSDKPVCS
jgi:hypothetical protein